MSSRYDGLTLIEPVRLRRAGSGKNWLTIDADGIVTVPPASYLDEVAGLLASGRTVQPLDPPYDGKQVLHPTDR